MLDPRPARGPSRRRLTSIVYAVSMVAVIVGVDLLFFRNHPWERLAVNVAIVVVFGAAYLRFFRRA